MKPGNLLSQGAKSGGKRKMRIRYTRTSSPSVCGFLCLEVLKGKKESWKKDCLLLNV